MGDDTPWVDEPDERDGSFGDVPWVLRRGPEGLRHWCGYIAIPPGHPWHGLDYDSVPADVHGGLTYATGDARSDFPHLPGGWWIGFDCAHLGDLVPGMVTGRFARVSTPGETYKTIEHAQREVESLGRQVAEAMANAGYDGTENDDDV